MKKRVLLAVGDIGAWNYFDSVLPKMQEFLDVDLRADPMGAAWKELERRNIPHTLSAGSDLFATGALDKYEAVLCGTAGKAFTLWKNASDAAELAGVPFAWFGDFYASGCESLMVGSCPTYFAAFDDTTAARFKNKRPHMPEKNLRIVGNPSFDGLLAFDCGEARRKTRSRLRIAPYEKFVVYSASSARQFNLDETSSCLVKWVTGRGKFAFANHPADEKAMSSDVRDIPGELAYIKERFLSELGPNMVDLRGVRGLDLIAAADVVVTDYGTEGVKSCLMGIPTAFLMFDSADEYLQRAKGTQHPHFSILEAGDNNPAPALGIYAPKRIGNLSWLFKDNWIIRQGRALAQPRFKVLCDGRAGERVVQFIKDIVSE